MKKRAALMVCFTMALLVLAMVVSPLALAAGEAAPFSDFINNIIRTIQGIAATIAVLFIVFGAVKLKAASGNPVAQQGAKATIFLAIAGLLVAVFAYDIVALITAAAGK
ncbi:MAG: hypothetical protein KJ907_07885 [Actinobacteria bacterium]|nr:hypothetical protein [Actinomycetota bacterium]